MKTPDKTDTVMAVLFCLLVALFIFAPEARSADDRYEQAVKEMPEYCDQDANGLLMEMLKGIDWKVVSENAPEVKSHTFNMLWHSCMARSYIVLETLRGVYSEDVFD